MEECLREMRESLTSRSFSGVRPIENVSLERLISRVAPPDLTMSLDTLGDPGKKLERMIPVHIVSFHLLTTKAQSPERLQRLRSEEHTSELQSQSNLVCRLLLEKKKKE